MSLTVFAFAGASIGLDFGDPGLGEAVFVLEETIGHAHRVLLRAEAQRIAHCDRTDLSTGPITQMIFGDAFESEDSAASSAE